VSSGFWVVATRWVPPVENAPFTCDASAAWQV